MLSAAVEVCCGCLMFEGDVVHKVCESNYVFCSLCYSEEFTLFDVKFHLSFGCPVLGSHDVLLQ